MQAILIAVALAAGAPDVKTADAPSTRLYVRTIPSGAQIKLDGLPRGKSDALFAVPPGVEKMTVEVELDGHQPQRQEVVIRGGRITRVELVMQKRPVEASKAAGSPAPPTPLQSPLSRTATDGANQVSRPLGPRAKLPITATEERIESVLAEKTSFHYASTPLAKVLDDLKAALRGVAMMIDQRALDDTGVMMHFPVDFSAEGVARRSVLDYVCSQLDLAWTVHGDALIVTSRDWEANDYMLTKVYPVADLALEPDALRGSILDTVEPRSWERMNETGRAKPAAPPCPPPGDPGIKLAQDAKGDKAARPSTSRTGIVGGDRGGGPGRQGGSVKLAPGEASPSLVIYQTYRIHRKIANLLTTLREVSAMQSSDGGAAEASRNVIYLGRRDDFETLERALRRPAPFNYSDQPLGDIVASIQNTYKVPIGLDRRALGEIGISADTKLTWRMSGVPLRQAFSLLLPQEGLIWTFRDDLVLITTPDRESERLLLAVYPARGVLKNGDSGPLLRTIQSTIAPVSWAPVGGPGAIAAIDLPGIPVLISSQTRVIHEEIAGLLEQLRTKAEASTKH